MNRSNKGFTFIELLITLILIGICFLPLMNMFSVSLQQNNQTSDLTIARYLAQEGMEKMKNLHLTVDQLKQSGDVWDPPLKEDPLRIDGKKWRILRKIILSQPLEARVEVFREEDRLQNDSLKPVVELVTLVEDLEW